MRVAHTQARLTICCTVSRARPPRRAALLPVPLSKASPKPARSHQPSFIKNF